MKKEDIPQDDMIYDGWRAVCYVVGDDGRYVIEKSAGWDVINVANFQAWEFITQKVDQVTKEILAGKVSILAYHMEQSQMNVSLLAKYVKLPKWRVRRHLKPSVFNHLKPMLLERYAKLFRVSVDELLEPPKLGDSIMFQQNKSKG